MLFEAEVVSAAPISEAWRLAMLSVGLDVHKSQSSLCVLDENGRQLSARTIRGPWTKVLRAVGEIKDPFAVCFEATTGYGYLYERLSETAKRVVVAHPGHLRLIFRAKRKNDRVDAQKLAKLLYLDEVPPVYVPPDQVRSWRRMIAFRSRLVAERTAVKSRIRALLRELGLTPPRGLWTGKGMAWLESQQLPTLLDNVQRDVLVDDLRSRSEKIKRTEKELNALGGKHPAVTLLMTIPGVGMRTAEAIVAYIDDPHRFSRNKAVGAYFGLVPCLDASAGRERLGHITRQGPGVVRRLLVEAAWQGVRRSPEIRAFFESVQKGDPDRKKIAIVATAHHLARVMHAMLRDNAPWRPSAAGAIVSGPSRTLRLRRSSLTARMG
jgi:transposase